jgi:hypothetical protein
MINPFESERKSKRQIRIERKIAKAKAEEKPHIYVSEELIRYNNNIYDIFLTVGGMADILAMKDKDLRGVVRRSSERATPQKGKLKVSRRTKYHDEMIKRGREERAKSKALENNRIGGKKWQMDLGHIKADK